MVWHQIADRLKGRSVKEWKKTISRREFLKWKAYLEMDVNAFHREDHFLAQIAAEIRAGNVKDPSKVKLEDFLIRFRFTEKATPAPELSAVDREAQLRMSKGAWLGAVGIT